MKAAKENEIKALDMETMEKVNGGFGRNSIVLSIKLAWKGFNDFMEFVCENEVEHPYTEKSPSGFRKEERTVPQRTVLSSFFFPGSAGKLSKHTGRPVRAFRMAEGPGRVPASRCPDRWPSARQPLFLLFFHLLSDDLIHA